MELVLHTSNRKLIMLTFIKKQNRTLILTFCKCGETYLMKHILLRKREPFFIITKPLILFPNIKAQTSDEIPPLNEYKNSTVVFDHMLLSKQENNIDLFFTGGWHNNTDNHEISQSSFHLPKFTIRNTSDIIFLFKQTLRDNIRIFHDLFGRDMNLRGWKELCRKNWENDCDC